MNSQTPSEARMRNLSSSPRSVSLNSKLWRKKLTRLRNHSHRWSYKISNWPAHSESRNVFCSEPDPGWSYRVSVCFSERIYSPSTNSDSLSFVSVVWFMVSGKSIGYPLRTFCLSLLYEGFFLPHGFFLSSQFSQASSGVSHISANNFISLDKTRNNSCTWIWNIKGFFLQISCGFMETIWNHLFSQAFILAQVDRAYFFLFLLFLH